MNTTTILPDEQMLALGFRDTGDTWRFFRQLCLPSISLTIRIRKDTGAWSEDVLDEDFGQPYHYGFYEPGKKVKAEVERIFAELAAAGLNVAPNHAAYGCTA